MSLLDRSRESKQPKAVDTQESKSILDKIREHKVAAVSAIAGFLAVTGFFVLNSGGEKDSPTPEQPAATAPANPVESPAASPSVSPTTEAIETPQANPETVTYDFDQYEGQFSVNDPVIDALEFSDAAALVSYGASKSGALAALELYSVLIAYGEANNISDLEFYKAEAALAGELLNSGLLEDKVAPLSLFDRPEGANDEGGMSGMSAFLRQFTEFDGMTTDQLIASLGPIQKPTTPEEKLALANKVGYIIYQGTGELPESHSTVDELIELAK